MLKELSVSKGIGYLHRQLLIATLKRKHEKINNVDRELNVIIERLRHRRVLPVLDDVDKLVQLNKILGKRDWLFPGSRVIITTRIKDFLQPPELYWQYEVKELGYGNSLQLLNLHAFDKSRTLEDYTECAEKVVYHAGGNPLALEVLDLLLFTNRSDRLCQGTKAVEGLVLNMPRLKHSWSAKAFKEMKMLRLLQLNYVSLTGSYELFFKEAEIPNLSHSRELMETPDFEDCPSLEKLIVKDWKGITKLNLSGCSQLEELPMSIALLARLIFLNLQGCENLKILPESIGDMKALQELNILGCSKFEELPESIGLLTHIVILNLQDCENLKHLPGSIGDLKSLEKLNMSGCSKLEELDVTLPLSFLSSQLNTVSLSKLQNRNNNLTGYVALRFFPMERVFDSISVPGSEIPDLFSHQSEYDAISLQVTPLVNEGSKSMCIATCTVCLHSGMEGID
ncbi:hypothetical protein RCOM_1176340 [Ricinus communis]|uniref:Uncharacterized protein n=1 Tax=Ricinus communis TaxID=3988 RepID=B9RW67_RICCO|nr:hypothetical protein RCOM_1176340 [Ricinus communis]